MGSNITKISTTLGSVDWKLHNVKRKKKNVNIDVSVRSPLTYLVLILVSNCNRGSRLTLEMCLYLKEIQIESR